MLTNRIYFVYLPRGIINSCVILKLQGILKKKKKKGTADLSASQDTKQLGNLIRE